MRVDSEMIKNLGQFRFFNASISSPRTSKPYQQCDFPGVNQSHPKVTSVVPGFMLKFYELFFPLVLVQITTDISCTFVHVELNNMQNSNCQQIKVHRLIA